MCAILMLAIEDASGTKRLYNRINRATHRGNSDLCRDVLSLTVKEWHLESFG
jgi:hypothetical protein